MHTYEQRRLSVFKVIKEHEFFCVGTKGHQAGLWAPKINIVQVYKLGCLMLKIGIQRVWLEAAPES